MTSPRRLLPVHPSYLRSTPFRPPEWRWLCGHRLVELGIPPVRTWYDWWTRTARYIAQARADGQHDPVQLAPMFEAEQMYNEDGPLRWAIESRSLAREPIASIAGKCGLLPDRVRAFQQLFFGVEDRLGAGDYIHAVVIGTHQPWLPSDVGRIWQYWGFVGGPEVLDYVIDHYRRVGQPDYSYLLSRSPDTRERDLNDLQWESTLRLRFAELTPKQTVLLADLAARHAMHEPAAPRVSPEIARSEWVQRQLSAASAAEPTMATTDQDRSVA